MIHKDLCDAKFTTYWSPLRMQLHFLFSTVHTWDCEIPLSLKEIKERLNCHMGTLKKLLNEAESDGIITRREGKIYFNKCVFDDSQPYVKNFPFLHTEEFRNEDVRVIRFVLHMLATGVYSRRRFFNNSLKNLFHREIYQRESKERVRIKQGLFNIFSAADMKKVLQKAKKYLVFAHTSEDIVRIVDLRSELHAPVVKNEGEILFIRKYLAEYGLGDVSEEAILELIKVNSRYVKGLGVELGKEFIKEVLFHLLSVLNGQNTTFISLLLSDNANVRELGLYYSKVCEEYEQTFAGILSRRKASLENADQVFSGLELFRSCQHWFSKKINADKEKITQFIALWEDYWLATVNKNYKSPDYVQAFLAKIKRNPLYKYLNKIPKVLASINSRKPSLQPGTFSFYNWLEN